MQIWQLRLMIGPADPRAFGTHRFMLVAAPTTASFTRKLVGARLLLFSALAMADLRVLDTKRADLR